MAQLRAQVGTRLFAGTPGNYPRDTSDEIIPRIMGMELAYRSRLVEELAMLQMILFDDALQPIRAHAKATRPAIVREIRALIKDQLKLVQDAPLSVGADAAKHQAAELLHRRAYLLAEARRRGLDAILDRTAPRAPGATGERPALKNPGLDEIVALTAGLEAEAASGDRARVPAEDAGEGEGYRDRKPE